MVVAPGGRARQPIDFSVSIKYSSDLPTACIRASMFPEQSGHATLHDGQHDHAQVVAEYLIGERASEEEVARWCKAVQVVALPLKEGRDKGLWRFAMRGPFMLGAVDAGLAISDRDSTIRQRIYLMLAVLEASPSHADHFLDKPWGLKGYFSILMHGGIAVVRALVGFTLIRSWGWLWR